LLIFSLPKKKMRYQRLKRFKRNQCLTPENQDKTI
jgi:hypothetical protein